MHNLANTPLRFSQPDSPSKPRNALPLTHVTCGIHCRPSVQSLGAAHLEQRLCAGLISRVPIQHADDDLMLRRGLRCCIRLLMLLPLLVGVPELTALAGLGCPRDSLTTEEHGTHRACGPDIRFVIPRGAFPVHLGRAELGQRAFRVPRVQGCLHRRRVSWRSDQYR